MSDVDDGPEPERYKRDRPLDINDEQDRQELLEDTLVVDWANAVDRMIADGLWDAKTMHAFLSTVIIRAAIRYGQIQEGDDGKLRDVDDEEG